ncbi:hypothetical protein [Carboxylicivirga sp. N1Y90]|uniref:hypothetical protein n=1 Tax=Carboxylicivirga fragile TaxID=3417571 RepID=UPI003D33A3EF|nr:hypothetical protein [Marinilabiliaceae bacterium N1Y90]
MNKQFKWLSLLLIVGLGFACEKKDAPQQELMDDALADSFFDFQLLKSNEQSAKVDFTLYSIEELKAYNDEVNFVPEFSNELGFADWSNARYFEVNNETVLQIPVYTETDTEVKALIIAVQKEDSFFGYVLRRNYFDEFINTEAPNLTLEKVIDLFILADFEIFGESSYFPYGKVRYGNKETEGSNLKSVVTGQTCYYMEVYNADWTLLDARWECETSYHYVYHFTAAPEDEGGGGGGFSGFGGGGNSDPRPTDPSIKLVMKDELCNSFNGIINLSTVDENIDQLTVEQEQYIIGLANLAAFHDLGIIDKDLKSNLCNFQKSSGLYSKYNKLNNYERYISGWDEAFNSSDNSDVAYLSPEINNSNFHLKFYTEKNGEKNAIGLVKEGVIDHTIEAALEFIERWYIDNKGKDDDFLYDMHLYNAVNFMEEYCDE